MSNQIGNLKDKSGNILFSVSVQKTFILYNSVGGTKDTVTLSDSLANYFKVDIQIRMSDGNNYETYSILNPNGKNWLYNRAEATVGGGAYVNGKQYYLNDKTITPTGESSGLYRIDTGAMSNYDNVYITMVIGYKQ